MRYLCLTLLLTACATARPQPAATAETFFLDPVGKEYFLLTDGSLETPNPLGQNRFAFFDSSRGRPDVVDVTNPFAVLLYYADYGEAIVLDRTLSEINRLDLFAVDGVAQPVALARATDNGIWLFDSWDYHLKLLDQRGGVARESNDLRLELGAREEPTAIYVYQNLVLLHYAEQRRLAVLTNYGRFQRWIDLPEGQDFAWLDGRLAGFDGAAHWTYDLRTNRVITQQEQEGPRTQVRGRVGERWLPTAGGYRRLDPTTGKTQQIEIK